MSAAERHLNDLASSIQTREDLRAFLKEFHQNLVDHPGAWDNDTLERFLEAMAAWAHDTQDLPDVAEWRSFASLLLAARVYE